MGKSDVVVEGADVPIIKLTPLKKRTISPKDYRKLKANLLAVGLIEPLCTYKEGDTYFILDGYIRYQIFLELGVESIPCLVLASKDIYTPNRQVNNLSATQEVRMLRKALEKIDEKTIADAFGMESLSTRLRTTMYKELHEEAIAAIGQDKLYLKTARELTYVTQKRQVEILRLMEESGDWSLPFAKAQILKTPQAQRAKKKKANSPWDTNAQNKRDLVKKLTDVEKHYDFYSGLYRQYVGDLLKLAIYIRQITTKPELAEYLASKHAEISALFKEVLAESEGKVAG